METKELKVKTTFVHEGHLLAYFLALILAKVSRERIITTPMRVLLDKKPNSFRKIFKVWLAVDALSIYINFLFKVYIPAKLGNTVLVEEYLSSSICSYQYYCRCLKLPLATLNFNFSSSLMLRLMLSLPTWFIFLDASSEVLKTRWRARRSPMERDDYIHARREILLPLLQDLSPGKLAYIRTDNRSVNEVHELIVKRLRL